MGLAARVVVLEANLAKRRAAGERRRQLERDVSCFVTPAERQDLLATLDRYPDAATREIRELRSAARCNSASKRGQRSVQLTVPGVETRLVAQPPGERRLRRARPADTTTEVKICKELDTTGGDIQGRSAGLIRAGGTLVSVVGPTEARPTDGLAIDSLSSPIVAN